MNIFEKRPLCLILCIGLCGFLFFALDLFLLKIISIAFSILLFIFALFFIKCKNKRRLLIILASVILIACICSFLYFECYFKAYEIYDGRVQVEGVVEKVTQSSSYTNRLLIKAQSINGKSGRGYRFYAYPTKNDSKGIIEGTRVSFTATLDGFSDESYTYNISNGINAYAGDVEDLTIIEYTDGTIGMRFQRIREYISRYIISITDSDSGAIIAALLLGERDNLPDQLRLDFKRIGISHILALSGMHLAILSAGIGKLLSVFHIKKKQRLIIISAFVSVYMALTGFSVSVVRAGIMLIIGSLLFLLSRSKDSLTSLALALFIICVITPNAILDISLWLSGLATFGIIAFSEFSEEIKPQKEKRKKLIRSFFLAVSVSVFAISSTIAVSTSAFGGFSILAPLTTIIFSVLSEIIMYLGCITIAVGWLIPLGWIIKPLCKLMTVLAGAFSSIKFAYVSSNFKILTILVIIYTVSFYLFIILNLKNRKRAFCLILIFYAVISILPTVGTVMQSNKETVSYYSDYKSDQFLVRSEKEVCLINSSQYSKNLAYTSLELLENERVTYLDKYYLTHYSWSIDDEIEALMYNISVEKIYLPAPRNEDEESILKVLYKTVENSRTEICVFKEYETVYVGDYTINLLYSEPYGSSSMNAFVIAKGDEVYTYISSGLLATDMLSDFEKYISLSDHLILGEHGKKYKEKIYIRECYSDLDTIIIQSENVFLLQNNMQYYINRGCHIYSQPDDFVYFTKQSDS